MVVHWMMNWKVYDFEMVDSGSVTIGNGSGSITVGNGESTLFC